MEGIDWGDVFRQGAFAAWAVVATLGCIRLYRDKTAMEEKHREEMKNAGEREVARTENMAGKVFPLAEKLYALADRFERRLDKRG